MSGWHSWLALIGGLLAVINQWYGAEFYLGVIGGILAIIAGIAMMTGK